MARRRRKGRRSTARRLGALLGVAALTLAVASLAPVLALRWLDPPASSVMLLDQLEQWVRTQELPALDHQWVPWERIPRVVALAVVAAEDQRFPDHGGFDLVELRRAWLDYRSGERLRGASTISQQVAKNVFLWQGRNLVRKGLEAWFTLLIETLWPKWRILEVYLNVAQFGPNTYGVGAASWRFFDRPAEALTGREAALLAAVLPNPERYRVETPSPYVERRAAWIRGQMQRLGGRDYLQSLGP